MNPAALFLSLTLLSPGHPIAALPEPHPTITHSAIAAAAIGQFTDVSTTMYAMGRGGFEEANPLLSWAEDKPVAMGVVKGLVATVTTVTLVKLHARRPKTTLVLALALTALQAWVTWRNAEVLR